MPPRRSDSIPARSAPERAPPDVKPLRRSGTQGTACGRRRPCGACAPLQVPERRWALTSLGVSLPGAAASVWWRCPCRFRSDGPGPTSSPSSWPCCIRPWNGSSACAWAAILILPSIRQASHPRKAAGCVSRSLFNDEQPLITRPKPRQTSLVHTDLKNKLD